MEHIDGLTLRKALGAFPTGVTVMTTLDATGRPCGITVNSFSSVSLTPPLILWSQSLSSRSYPVFRDAGRFVVNILSEHQIPISKQFSTASDDKFRNIVFRPGLGDVPIISSCAANLECVKISAHPEGDHVVYIGRVVRLERSENRPLVFGNGRYLVARAHQQDELDSVLPLEA
ncbi:flavin reductase family protein [Cupriavidus sp. UYPR2.512]|uniref:flavin reductase family protein n=1 Tax=Cupriavidus sp. UYPR2.512 TaxID=1080187 RepID=UPI00039AC1E4|nr:flavin reductase family protein [Cupriavidus sp. UYPR2.512]UIF87397.1 flavin reductase family protein [Cupriavidus necator]